MSFRIVRTKTRFSHRISYTDGMNIVLSHTSALEFWRKNEKATVDKGVRSRRRILPKTVPVMLEMSALIGDLPWYIAQRPLHLLVGDVNARRIRNDVSFHTCGESLRAGSLCETSRGFWVSSPEYCFLQMASTVSLLELIILGYELCGLYRLAPNPENGEIGLISANPLTNTARLTDFLAKSEGMKGRKRALRALQHIADNSASPRETALTMLLCLPYKLGGFGFKLPELNYRIDISKTHRSTASKSHYYCDLFWPAPKLAVEYDSDQFHTESEQIASDAKRRNALESQGITVITVTRQQVNAVVEFNKVGALISKHLGKRIQYLDPGFTRAHRALRKTLFSW
jgi:very-short-patch-repair endonuclease